ncbi:MAG: aldo/keto reductase [bacterium]
MRNPRETILSRRDILRATGAAVPGILLEGCLRADRIGKSEGEALPIRPLGRTGAPVSILTLGTGHLRSQHGIDAAQVEGIVDRALELGVTSIDTAPNYSEAEEYLGHALKSRRNQVFLATKSEEPTYEGCWNLLHKSLKRLQTDYIDLVYIHNIGLESRFPNVNEVLGPKGTLAALSEAKRQGVIRFIGASGHFHPARFKSFLERDEIDVVMTAVNLVARHIYNFEEKVFLPAQRKNLGLVAMKVLGGAWKEGKARLPDEHYDAAIRYAMEIPGISTLNIGVRNVAELERAAQAVRTYVPLTKSERIELSNLGKQLAESWGPIYGEPIT